MGSDIRIFKNEQFGQVRIVMDENDEPLFCLADVCKAVGLTNPSSVKSRLDKDDVQLVDLYALNQNEGVIIGNSIANFITESGLYDVFLYSDAPQVKPFRKWVTREVLPSVRKYGAYMSSEVIERTLTDPDYLIRLATQLKEERQKRLEVEEKNRILTEDNTHKAQVIEGLVYEIPVADMRQRINQIVLKDSSSDMRGKWMMLYDEFDRKYHMKVAMRMTNAGYEGTRMDYIDYELHMITELYDLACKLFESSYEQLMESWGKYAKRAKRY